MQPSVVILCAKLWMKIASPVLLTALVSQVAIRVRDIAVGTTFKIVLDVPMCDATRKDSRALTLVGR